MKSHRSLADCAGISGGAAVAIGLFDGLHRGHLAILGAALTAARERSLQSVVLTFPFTGDNHPDRKRAGERLITESLFAALLEEMGVEHLVALPFCSVREMSADTFVREVLHEGLGARCLLCGENFRFARGAGSTPEDMARIAGRFGTLVSALPMIELDGLPISSTRIRAALAAGELPLIERMLGRRYTFDFEVSREIGTDGATGAPVLRQEFPGDFMKPRLGVYESAARIEGRIWPGVTAIVPEAAGQGVLAETRIAGFEGNPRGERVLVELLRFVGEEPSAGLSLLA